MQEKNSTIVYIHSVRAIFPHCHAYQLSRHVGMRVWKFYRPHVYGCMKRNETMLFFLDYTPPGMFIAYNVRIAIIISLHETHTLTK